MRLPSAPRHAFRLAALAFALALLAVPGVRAIPPGGLSGLTIQVTPVDRDANGLWDTVLVNVTLNVTQPGLFEVEAMFYLLGSTGYVRSIDGEDVNLTAGTHTVSVPLDATGAHQRDGPYSVAVIVSTVDGTALTPLQSVTQATPAWTADRFDEPAVQLAGAISNQGVDVHGDGLFDELVVHVPLKVLRPTVVAMSGSLSVSSIPSLPAPARRLQPGVTTWDVAFDASLIRRSRTNGSYRVDLVLTGPRGWSTGMTYQTRSYSYVQFARPPADFKGAPTFATIDTNGNGKAEFLRIRVPLRVRLPGNYTVVATATRIPGAALPLPFPERHVYLAPGDREVDLNVSGIALSRILGAQPLNAQVLVYPFAIDATGYALGNATIVTYPAFDPAVFEYRAPENLSLNVLSGCTYIPGVMDPTTKFAWSEVRYPPNPATISLYNGTFDVLVTGCNRSSQVVRAIVQGPTLLNVTVPEGAAPAFRQGLNLTSWDAGTLDATVDLGASSSVVRWWADYFGNMDGTADAQELSRVADGISYWNYAWYVTESALIDPERAYVVGMDGSNMARAATQVLAWGSSAGLASPAPAALTIRDHLEATGPVASSGEHRLTVDLGPTWRALLRSTNETFALRLPVGSSGNLTATSHIETAYEGFDLTANTTVTRTGTGSWDVAFPPLNPYSLSPLDIRLTVSAVQTGGHADVTGILLLGLLPVAILAAIIVVLLFRGRKKKPDEPRGGPPAAEP